MVFKKNSVFQVSFILYVLLSVNLSAQEVVKVDFTKTYQKIDGFGASTAWHGQLTDKEADVSFGTGDDQLGLSIIRLRIDPSGQSMWGDELVNAKKAMKRGAIVMATPWTPPVSLKTNGSVVGGEVKPTEYGNFVKYLNTYIDYMANNSVPLSAISLQNEPNYEVTYESCDWNATQMLDFCKNYAQDIKAPVMVPETYNFDQAFSDSILNDSTAAAHIAIIGGHIYGATIKSYPNALAKGKPVWMTEHYIDDDDITACMTMAKEIYDCMNCNMNAYIWWWLRVPTCNLITTGGNSILKKGYTMAHFSRFVRPGYYRAGATYNPYLGMNFCPFTGDKQVIVAINRALTTKTVQFQLTGDTAAYYQVYKTTADKNLVQEGTVEALNHILTVELESKSITTFVSTTEACVPATLTPYLKVDNGEFQQIDSINVSSESTIQLEPQASTSGTWSWSGCDVSGSSSSQTFISSGSCQAIATFSNQCGAKSSLAFHITVTPVGSHDLLVGDGMGIYPNPVENGKFILRVEGYPDLFPMEMKILDVEGREVFKKSIVAEESFVETKLSPALYMVRLSGKSLAFTQRVMLK